MKVLMRNFYRFIAMVVAAALLVCAAPIRSDAQDYTYDAAVLLSLVLNSGPPPLPQYDQPPAYQQNMIWQPGYWSYGQGGYFWVPGTWVNPPQPNLYWTPGYWGYNNGGYRWNNGYWGQSVGYYGGVNYGNGYYGNGYNGGRWQNNQFYYNTAITNVPRSYTRYVYVDRAPLANQYNGNRVSYNGGRGGIVAQPTQTQIAVGRQQHYPMTTTQTQHIAVAAQNRNYLASVNHGTPAAAAVAQPLSATNRPAGFATVKSTDRAPVQDVKPVQQQHAAPVQQPHAAPVQQPHAAPVQQPHAAPVQQPHAAPVQQPHAAPVQQQHAAPVQQQHAAPVQQQHAVPVQQQHAVPVQHAPTQQHVAQKPAPESRPSPRPRNEHS
jgi:hypothetical protein